MRYTRRPSILHDCIIGLAHLIVLAPLTAVLASCGGDAGSSAPANNTLAAIEVTPTWAFSGVGLTLQVKATGTYGTQAPRISRRSAPRRYLQPFGRSLRRRRCRSSRGFGRRPAASQRRATLTPQRCCQMVWCLWLAAVVSTRPRRNCTGNGWGVKSK